MKRVGQWLKGIDRGWLLYAITLLLELVAVQIRYFVLVAVVAIFFFFARLTVLISLLLTGEFWRGGNVADSNLWSGLFVLSETAQLVILLLAWGPVVLSLFALTFPTTGAYLTRWSFGARDPSRREAAKILEARNFILANTPPALADYQLPTSYFVIDDRTENAFALGTTVYLTRSLVKSEHLAPLLAHEIGHINNGDGRMQLALRSLVLPPFYLISRSLGQVAPGAVLTSVATFNASGCLAMGLLLSISGLLSIAGGGFGLWLLTPFWTSYWREREYAADRVVQKFALGMELVTFLEEREQVFDVAVPYFLSPKPPTELRIDRILKDEEGEAASSEEIEELGVPAKATNKVARYLLGAVAVLLLLWVVGRNFIGGVEGDWTLVALCPSDGCAEEMPMQDTGITISFKNDNQVVVSGPYSSSAGKYSYEARNALQIDMDQPTEAGLDGRHTLKWQRGMLVLSGPGRTLMLARKGDPIPGVTATTQGVQDTSSSDVRSQLAGIWKPVDTNYAPMIFYEDGTWGSEQGNHDGSYTVIDQDTIRTNADNGTEHVIDFTIQGDQLTLVYTTAENETVVFERGN
jgi:Zn-dependent protease with chaperone function